MKSKLGKRQKRHYKSKAVLGKSSVNTFGLNEEQTRNNI